jgi:hypothetical protein
LSGAHQGSLLSLNIWVFVGVGNLGVVLVGFVIIF